MHAEIIGLCVAKNEADIIETMIRHNLCYLDRLRIVDNGSADSTAFIVRRLQDEFGERLELKQDAQHGHQQTKIINETLCDTKFTKDAGQIVLLDADEFIKADRDHFRTTLMEKRSPILLPWVSYIPSSEDDQTEVNPIARIRHRKAREKPQFFKVTVPSELLGRSWVRPGSHSIRSKMPGFESEQMPGLSLAHYPVRTCEQLISKVLIGTWNIRLRHSKTKGEAKQWREIADRIVSGWLPTEADLQDLSLNYLSKKPSPILLEPLSSPISFDLRFTDSTRDVLLKKLIAFTEATIGILENANHLKEQTSIAQEDQ